MIDCSDNRSEAEIVLTPLNVICILSMATLTFLVATGGCVAAIEGIVLGAPVGFFVGAAVGTGTRGDGFGENDGLADTTAVGAFDATSDGIAVAFGVGAKLGLLDMEGAVVFNATGAVVGARVGAIVTVEFGIEGDEVGSSLKVILLPTGVGAGVCAVTVIISTIHRKRRQVFVIAAILDFIGNLFTEDIGYCMLNYEKSLFLSVCLVCTT
jgi:hypothetical protein